MKKLKLILSLLLVSLPFFAQIEVVSFEYLQTDLTANTAGTTVYDQNGEKCALIKIRTTPVVVKDFIYDVGRLGIVETKINGAEIWLYVPHSVRKISISHEKFGFLDKYDLGIPVKKAQTYLLTLNVGNGQVPIVDMDDAKEQYLIFSVEPKTALVQVDGEFLILNDGVSNNKLPLGTYDYRVEAADYHVEVGKVTLSNPEEPTKINVSLRPAYGWLELSGEGNFNDAIVYLDNKLLGKAPLVTDKLPSGEHSLLLMKNKYNTYEKKITISDNDTIKLTPHLSGNFVPVEIQTIDGAEIWVNHEIKGVSNWKGELEYGRYVVEAKKECFYTTTTTCEVEPDDTAKSVIISELKPIYGKVDIQVSPSFSKVYVDGEYKGETPYFHDLIIGEHLLEVKNEGKSSLRMEFILREGETRKVSGTLHNGPIKTIVKSDLDVVVYVDGKKKGVAPWSGNLSLGMHEFEFRKEGYETQKITENIHYDGQIVDVPDMKAILYEVAVYVTPDSSDIYVDDEHKGVTPALLYLPMGSHNVKITKKGMKPFLHPIYVNENSQPALTGDLKIATKKDLEGEYAKDILYSDYEELAPTWRTVDDSIENLKGYRKTLRKFYYSAGVADLTNLRLVGTIGRYYGLEASLFDFRVMMMEFSLLNFSMYSDELLSTMDQFYDTKQYLAYSPTVRLHFPMSRKLTCFFAGAPIIVFADGNIDSGFYQSSEMLLKYRFDVGFRFDSGYAFGLDFFARYQQDCGIMGGVALHFTTNGDRARDLRRNK